MRTASTLLQTLALGALLAAQVHGAITMPGVRQALRMIAGQPAAVFCTSAVRIAALAPSATGSATIEPCP
jgi:hypothetical protein